MQSSKLKPRIKERVCGLKHLVLHCLAKAETISEVTVCEMAEKRAFARAVLKVTGFYAEGVYSEDESDSFKKDRNNKKEIINLNK